VQETLTDGMDTVWCWGYDEDETEDIENYRVASKGLGYDSYDYTQYAKVKPDSTIYINFGSTQKTINKGLYGFHIADIYGRKQIPNDTSAIDQWNWMSNLAPNSLRFPGGADSKFMHLLEGPGYGYVLDEIIRFYDRTDSIDNAPSFNDIVDSLEDDVNKSSFYSWISDKDVEDFVSFGDKCLEQLLLDSTHRYIDDFIEMIKKIETENPGHSVEVIVDLNIMNESATECKRIVDYLRGNPIANGNPIHDVNVAYVELGNEMYFDFSQKMLGIYTLEDYWQYINGGLPDTIAEILVGLDSNLIGSDVWFDHDYISAFKKPLIGSCKVALPVENLHNPIYALRESASGGPRAADDWNDDLFEKRLEYVEITGLPGHYRKKFDAYTIHGYYDGHNWDTIALNHLDETYSCDPPDTLGWLYNSYDPRLEGAFDGIAKNIKKFINTRYLESWNVHKDTLGLNLTIASGGKDIITSEYNFKTGTYPDSQSNQINVYGQTLAHCVILQEWWLKNLKINFNSNYREGFFKYANLHNYAGASYSTMMSPANDTELDSLGRLVSPYTLGTNNPDSRNYYMKRATFFVMEMLSEIPKNNLKYLQTNFTIAKNNINVQPTVFINPEKTFFYIYFTNAGDDPQFYYLNIAGTYGIYPPDGHLSFSDTATIYCVDALKPYSTSGKGKSSLFTMNECYDDPSYNVNYQIEIDTIISYTNNPSVGNAFTTIEVPAYSFGYIKVPIEGDYPPYDRLFSQEYNTMLYPNPANNHIRLFVLLNNSPEIDNFKVKIVNMQGGICFYGTAGNTQSIDVSNLSAGLYVASIELGNGIILNKQFVKQ